MKREDTGSNLLRHYTRIKVLELEAMDVNLNWPRQVTTSEYHT